MTKRKVKTKRILGCLLVVMTTVSVIFSDSFSFPKMAYHEKNSPAGASSQISEETELKAEIDESLDRPEADEANGTESSEIEGQIIPEAKEGSSQTGNDNSQNAGTAEQSAAQSSTTNKDSAKERNKNSTGSALNTEEEKDPHFSGDPVSLSQAEPYYYSKLNNTEKDLYNRLLDGVNALSASIDLGYGISKANVDNAYNAMMRDQSQVFWVGNSCTLLKVTTSTESGDIDHFSLEPMYIMSGSAVASAKSQLNGAVSKILSDLNSSMSQLEMELAVHDYIIRKVTFNNKAVSNPQSHPNAYTSYGALVEGSAVCEGYAKAFQLVMNKIGIQTALVCGRTSNSKHMWNMAKISGHWYHVDVTFDDPNKGNSDAVLRDYFNLTASEIGKSRVIDNHFSYPNASSASGNYFRSKGLYFESYSKSAADKLYNEVVSAIRNKRPVAQIRIGGGMSSARSVLGSSSNDYGLIAIKSAAQKATGVKISRFSYATDASLGTITVYLSY